MKEPLFIVFGGSGLLGSHLVKRIREAGLKYKSPTSRANGQVGVDIGDRDDVHAWLLHTKTARPTYRLVVINCAGMTNVDACEAQPHAAETFNTDAVEVMAKWCGDNGARFIQISTDFVFHSPNREGPAFTENDQPDPAKITSVYGKTKWHGETVALANCEDCLVVRTSWLFGPHPSKVTFPQWFIESVFRTLKDLRDGKIAAGDPVHKTPLITDRIGNPTYAPDLAALLFHHALSDRRGILHCCGDEVMPQSVYGSAALACYLSSKRNGDKLLDASGMWNLLKANAGTLPMHQSVRDYLITADRSFLMHQGVWKAPRPMYSGMASAARSSVVMRPAAQALWEFAKTLPDLHTKYGFDISA